MKQTYFEKHNVKPWYGKTISRLFEDKDKKTLLPEIEPEDIEIGDQFYLFQENHWTLITITYIRSGVIFYVSEDDENENWFQFGSIVFTGNLTYKEIIIPIAPEGYKQWIFKSLCPKTIIRYE